MHASKKNSIDSFLPVRLKSHLLTYLYLVFFSIIRLRFLLGAISNVCNFPHPINNDTTLPTMPHLPNADDAVSLWLRMEEQGASP